MNKNAIKLKRQFIGDDLKFEWGRIEPYFQNLNQREISSLQELKKWLKDRSELAAVLEEEFAWRYIRMNVDTENEEHQKSFQFFIQNIHPKIAPLENELNKKLASNPFSSELDEKKYELLLRAVKNDLELFREENIPLFTKLEEESQKYGAISAKMTIHHNGMEYTLQEAAKFLKSKKREIRKEIFIKINQRRLENKVELNRLFDDLIELREKVAQNADFENYRDYMFRAMGRFDYTVEDCFKFHQSIKKTVVPLTAKLAKKRKELLHLDKLRPWDTGVDISGENPLQPFKDSEELLEKTIECFKQIDPFFGKCLREMQINNHLDLASKKGKAPGGFNYPLYESGYPFIFMNAVGTTRDVTTMIHEGGHAIHSILSHQIELTDFKNLTSEIAELASMSMELISMDHWEIFYPNHKDLKRAKRDQLIDILNTLPWVATIDRFQHWIYTHQNHTHKERYNYWLNLMQAFGNNEIDWTGYEEIKENLWQKQLHLYEVPFYYIEYGMAQLGAIAVWKNYRENPKLAIENYKKALSLGYTKPIPEIYQDAGIEFNFSEPYIQELIEFIYTEIQKTF